MSIETTNIKPELINELLRNGFKLIKDSEYFFINSLGTVYNAKRETNVKPYRNKKGYYLITINGNTCNLAKLIIDYFGNNENRTDYIRFKDENKENLSIENIEYCTLSDLQRNKPKTHHTEPTKRKKQELSPKTLASHYKYYTEFTEKQLLSILNFKEEKLFIESRILDIRNETKDKYLKMIVFIDYCNSKSIETISKHYEISESNVRKLIFEGRKQLITDIKTDIANNLFADYKEPEPEKKQTKREMLKELNLKYGLKLPLRKKSIKEKMNEYLKHIEKIRTQTTN